LFVLLNWYGAEDIVMLILSLPACKPRQPKLVVRTAGTKIWWCKSPLSSLPKGGGGETFCRASNYPNTNFVLLLQSFNDCFQKLLNSPFSPNMADGIDRQADERIEFTTSKEVTVAPTFEHMQLKENLLRGIYAYGFESPSAVQSRAIVQICKGRDTIAQAQSGTGKTATFSISILQVIDTSVRETQGKSQPSVRVYS
jgi:hypothetical protein